MNKDIWVGLTLFSSIEIFCHLIFDEWGSVAFVAFLLIVIPRFKERHSKKMAKKRREEKLRNLYPRKGK
jgi:hypothetical protein